MKFTSLQSLSLACAVTALFATSTAAADFAPRCDTIYFEGATQQAAPNTPFVGELTATNLSTGEVETASVVTMLLGYVSPDGGRAVTSHEISGGGEPGFSFVTFDDAQLIPQGQGSFTLISHMEVKSGKGEYNCGELVIGADPFAPENNSRLTFDLTGTGAAVYSGFGRLCRCNPADN